jgi:hypothetical protein
MGTIGSLGVVPPTVGNADALSEVDCDGEDLAFRIGDFGGLDVSVGSFKPDEGSRYLCDEAGASSAALSSTTFGL